MIYSVEISEQAENDLKEIFEYITFALLSPQNAVKQLKRLEQAISGLDIMPERFRRYEKEPWHSRGMRLMPVDNYNVFYIADKNKKKAVVIRVMYQKRDQAQQLKSYNEKDFLMDNITLY